MDAETPDGQLAFPEVRPPVRIPPRLYVRPEGDKKWAAKPVEIWSLCKEAALEVDWGLRRWEEFRKTADACLSAAAGDEEMALFMRVVKERFEVSD